MVAPLASSATSRRMMWNQCASAVSNSVTNSIATRLRRAKAAAFAAALQKELLQFATISDDDLGSGATGSAAEGFDFLDDVHAFDDAAKHDVFAVQPIGVARS